MHYFFPLTILAYEENMALPSNISNKENIFLIDLSL